MKTWLFCLTILAPTMGFCAQVPLYSAFRLAPQVFNPAYTGFENRYCASFVGGSGFTAWPNPEGFQVKQGSNNMDISYYQIVKRPNYHNYNLSAPVRLGKNRRLGLGLTFNGNDLNKLETQNSFMVSLSYSQRLNKGRLAYGFSVKRNIMKTTADRVNTSYDPYMYHFLTADYRQVKSNLDFGIMYINDSSKFDIGLSVCNAVSRNYGVVSADSKYLLYYNSTPQVVGMTNFQFRLRGSMATKNSVLVATNRNLKYTHYLVRSLFHYKSFGIGAQYEHSYINSLGPTLSFSRKYFDLIYSYKFDFKSVFISEGLHEWGIKVKI